MKKSLFFIGLLLLLLTTGCGTVVYRINPESPPRMSASEATDAIELSFTLIDWPQRFENVKVKDDAIDFLYTLSASTGSAGRGYRYKVDYDRIDHEVIKQGNSYTAVVPYSSMFGSGSILLTWKSEEDARNFVDATYILRRKKFPDKNLGQAATAQAHPVPSKKFVADKGKSKSIKSEPPEAAKKKDAVVVAVQTPPVEAPSTATVNKKTPPKITITSPDITGSLKVQTRQSSISVVGIAESKSGITEVTVNGLQANLNENGNFSADVLLKVGQNNIVVTAVDTQRDKTTNHFTIQRERASELALTNKLTPAISGQKIPPKITITSPDVTRSLKVVARQSRITVAGVAESIIGITEVSVNGLQAELDEKGTFSADVKLKIGQNTIVVTAIDIQGERTTNQFTLHRGSGKVAQVKKEDFSLEPGIPSANYHALFIAVEDYESKDIGKLDYAISDARRLRDVLVSNYTFEKENTILLENPDRRVIYKTLQGLRSKLTDKDNLLIFYAGHGYWLDDMKQGFWLPRDASGINDPSDWISNSSIRDYIKSIRAKHILLIADACFSGGMFKVRDAFPGRQVSIEKIYEQPSRKAITSGSMKTVPDRSVFLEFLEKRLKENNEMYLDTQKLFTSLRDAVINNSPIHQTPLYGAIGETGDEGGDFIFIKRQ